MAIDKIDKTKCLTGKYNSAMWFRGTIICLGHEDQPRCPMLKECIEQYRDKGIVENSVLDKIIKKYV